MFLALRGIVDRPARLVATGLERGALLGISLRVESKRFRSTEDDCWSLLDGLKRIDGFGLSNGL